MIPGEVYRLFVNDTKPPKVKYLIVISVTESAVNYASVFINSEINTKTKYSDLLQQAMISIDSNRHSFLKYDSFVDCSQVEFRSKKELVDAYQTDKNVLLGNVNKEKMNELYLAILHAPSIKGKIKKRLGLHEMKLL